MGPDAMTIRPESSMGNPLQKGRYGRLGYLRAHDAHALDWTSGLPRHLPGSAAPWNDPWIDPTVQSRCRRKTARIRHLRSTLTQLPPPAGPTPPRTTPSALTLSHTRQVRYIHAPQPPRSRFPILPKASPLGCFDTASG
ncbi:hypothetical protein N7468_010505 [Penicillium chermesinum]|uniref:Uncharacterized protein n=1 Tax=Penicillium chermesinum TaxID=63820 RepID=A0A9W9N7T5_9EURO|nr:uncharacterized protein N7468_010505 [Penicillium chermesinum]KAJ5214826.1 hypothetical protein N7468_010505 [Penicillium chermesinum]